MRDPHFPLVRIENGGPVF